MSLGAPCGILAIPAQWTAIKQHTECYLTHHLLCTMLTALVTASTPMPTRHTAAFSRQRDAKAPATTLGSLEADTESSTASGTGTHLLLRCLDRYSATLGLSGVPPSRNAVWKVSSI
eukprot:GHRR01017516.1.p1 GENE.GHRR01017516.1~~GHRR01017516.1.p1  ORF type:complete len:117 (-),score=13.27 GHRR01017516.1:17-367(-)